jgi:hypothetical protein
LNEPDELSVQSRDNKMNERERRRREKKQKGRREGKR